APTSTWSSAASLRSTGDCLRCRASAGQLGDVLVQGAEALAELPVLGGAGAGDQLVEQLCQSALALGERALVILAPVTLAVTQQRFDALRKIRAAAAFQFLQ